MKAKGASTSIRTDRITPDIFPIDPKINALLATSHVCCSCVSNRDLNNPCMISKWIPSSEEIRSCQHKKADNFLQVELTTSLRVIPRSSALPKIANSAPPTGQATSAQKSCNRQTVARKKQKPSEFQHFMTAAEHISWYRESYTSCPALSQFPHFPRTFNPSLSVAQENNTVGIDKYAFITTITTYTVATGAFIAILSLAISMYNVNV